MCGEFESETTAMEVTDPRTVVDFQKTTFCGHVRAHVVKVLLQNIQLGHADYSCYWSLELLCSGLVHTLWISLMEGAALHINRAQPNVFLYLADAYEKYVPLEGQYAMRDMTLIRNNQDVRRMICEAAATISMCRKNKLPNLPTIKPTHDFDPVTIQESVKAPSVMYGKVALRREDPLAVAVPINEFCYAIRQDIRDVTKSLYWMAWVFAYCREHKKQTKQAVVFANRTDEFVSVAHGNHVVWLFWDCIRKQAQPSARQYIDVLYKMYCLRWSPSDAKSRQAFLTAAIILVCEGPSLDTTPVSGQSLAVVNVLSGIPGWIDAITRMQKSFST
jgi:hypothetical protein